MAGDHLGERQRTTAWFQNSMLDIDNVRAAAMEMPSVTAADFTNSRITLPRQGRAGIELKDKSVWFRNPARPQAPTEGVAIECVYWTNTTAFGFFGGPWGRNVVRYAGPYGFNIGIDLQPMDGQATDTQGKAQALVVDIGQDRILSRNVVNRIPINDGRPHHLMVIHWPGEQGVSLFVDGVLAEACQVKPGCGMFDLVADCMNASVEKFFTHCEGSISHMAASPSDPLAVNNFAEVKARANLVKGLPPNEQVMGWSSEKQAWLPVRDAVGRRKVRKP
jgi:hypothetical protein